MSTKTIEQSAQKFYDEILNDLLDCDDGVDLWEKSKDVLHLYMEKWAQEKAAILSGELQAGEKLTIEKGQQQISFIKESLKSRFKVTALNRLISKLKDTFAKHLVPHLLWRK